MERLFNSLVNVVIVSGLGLGLIPTMITISITVYEDNFVLFGCRIKKA